MDENRKNYRYSFFFDNGLRFRAHFTLGKMSALIGFCHNGYGERTQPSCHHAFKRLVEQGSLIPEGCKTSRTSADEVELQFELSNGFAFTAVLDEPSYEWLYRKALDNLDLHLTFKQLVASGSIVGEKDFREEGAKVD